MAFETTAKIASFGGKLLKLKHKSSSTNTDMALNLYLPPQAFKSDAKVPVLFYLSGLTCTGDNCSEKGFFQHGASQKGIAVVYPDTSPRMRSIIPSLNVSDDSQVVCRSKERTMLTTLVPAPASM